MAITTKKVQNQVLGKGRLYFAPYKTGTTTPRGERYIGNTPSFGLTISAETIDHFNSDEGIKEKDKSVPLSTDRKGAFEADDIDLDNVALFFFSDGKETIAQALVNDHTETLTDVEKGLYYQLGADLIASGVRNIANLVVEKGATTFVEGTDYEVDLTLARILVLSTGSIANGDDLELTYDITAHSRDQVQSGSQPVEGALRFEAINPEGANVDYYMPDVKLAPNGDYALKGDDWQKMAFNVEVLLKTGQAAAIYADGRPYTP